LKNNKKNVIFDMDGVIFDTERLMLNCWKCVCPNYGITDIEKIYPSCIGIDERQTLEIFNIYYGGKYPLAEIRQKVIELMRAEVVRNGPPMKPYVGELLSYLQDSGFHIALASSTETQQVIHELTQAGIITCFEAVIGGDMVSHGKPAPDIFLFACRELGCEPANTFVIEDSPNGIQAAFSAGTIPAILIPAAFRFMVLELPLFMPLRQKNFSALLTLQEPTLQVSFSAA